MDSDAIASVAQRAATVLDAQSISVGAESVQPAPALDEEAVAGIAGYQVPFSGSRSADGGMPVSNPHATRPIWDRLVAGYVRADEVADDRARAVDEFQAVLAVTADYVPLAGGRAAYRSIARADQDAVAGVRLRTGSQ